VTVHIKIELLKTSKVHGTHYRLINPVV